MNYSFKAQIYQTGINWCVDVPLKISNKLIREKGYIKVKGEINGFGFKKSLVPVKDAPFRLYVNAEMMKGAKTAVGKIAQFDIEQNHENVVVEYAVPELLLKHLKNEMLLAEFDNLTASRRKDILKYLNSIKTNETLKKNIDKLINQLRNKDKNVRIP